MYYRCDPVGKIKKDGNDGAYCYARSEDGGRTFKKPNIHKETNSNKMAFGDGIHAFSAFIDPRPGIPKEERYKGIGVFNERYSSGGWVAFTSSDGVNYSQVPDTHLFIRQKFLKANGDKYRYAFDSLNAINYDSSLKKFVAVVRVVQYWEHRTFMIQVSDDWLVWDDKKWVMANVEPGYQRAEGIYVANAVQCPTKECAHLYIGTATRFNGKILGGGPGGCMRQLKFGLDCEDASSDVVFIFSDMTENAKGPYKWVRPSLEPVADFGSINHQGADKKINLGHWLPRNTFATRGLIDKPEEEEMWFYVLHDATWPNAHIRRYSIPRLRFGSITCAASTMVPCEVNLRVMWIDMDRFNLYINGKSIDIFGYINVKLQYLSRDNKFIDNPTYTFSNCVTFVGDSIERKIEWGAQRWKLRHDAAVIWHKGPRKDVYESFRNASNRPYEQGVGEGLDLRKFYNFVNSNGENIMTRTNKETGKKQVAVRVMFEMFKFNLYGISFK